jgi:hypothetical protein
MSLTDVLEQEAELSYAVTEDLFKLVDAGELGWKPSTGYYLKLLGKEVNTTHLWGM